MGGCKKRKKKGRRERIGIEEWRDYFEKLLGGVGGKVRRGISREELVSS